MEKAAKSSKLAIMNKNNTAEVSGTTSKTNKVVVESHNPNMKFIVQNYPLALVVNRKKVLLKYMQGQFGDVCTLINVLTVIVNRFMDEVTPGYDIKEVLKLLFNTYEYHHKMMLNACICHVDKK